MLEALDDFVSATLSPELQLELDHEDAAPRTSSGPCRTRTLGVQMVFSPRRTAAWTAARSTPTASARPPARHDIGLATAVFATFLGSDPIMVGSTEEQKKDWLGSISEQGTVFAYGATEPRRAPTSGP
ncbi:MAG: hypothetical protein R2734_17005 [Nocardioides sp.]